MEGYSVTEAASVLGVPTERVWELLARGVLAGVTEGETGMRVFLQPRPAPAPSSPPTPSFSADPAPRIEPERELSPFRELLTEFRNLTERYGQALLALGEARGEVATLRSRVDLLEARMDLRLPAPAGAWPQPTPMPPGPTPTPAAGQATLTESAPAGEGPAADDVEEDAEERRARRRRNSQRRATEAFAEALARAEDPSIPELPGAAETAAALAALREVALAEPAEAALPRELPAAESMPVAEEAPATGDVALTDEPAVSAVAAADAADAFMAAGTPGVPGDAAGAPPVDELAPVEEGATIEEPAPFAEPATDEAPALTDAAVALDAPQEVVAEEVVAEEVVAEEVVPEEPAPAAEREAPAEAPAPIRAAAFIGGGGPSESLAGIGQGEEGAAIDERASVVAEAADIGATETERAGEAELPERVEAEPSEPQGEMWRQGETPEEGAWVDKQAASMPDEPPSVEAPREVAATAEPEQPAAQSALTDEDGSEGWVEPAAASAGEWDRDRYTNAIEEPDWYAPDDRAVPIAVDEGTALTQAPVGDEPTQEVEAAGEPRVEGGPARQASADEPASAADEETVLWFGRQPNPAATPMAIEPEPTPRGEERSGADEMEVAGARGRTALLPGSSELDDALAALDALARQARPPDDATSDASARTLDDADTEWPPAASARGERVTAPPQVDREPPRPPPYRPTTLPPSPASRAYRRLRRIFPG